MHPVRRVEMQCTRAEFLRELPAAISHRSHAISDDRVVVRDGAREIRIVIAEQPMRRLGSLALPVQHITLEFVGYSEQDADAIMAVFHRQVMRAGG